MKHTDWAIITDRLTFLLFILVDHSANFQKALNLYVFIVSKLANILAFLWFWLTSYLMTLKSRNKWSGNICIVCRTLRVKQRAKHLQTTSEAFYWSVRMCNTFPLGMLVGGTSCNIIVCTITTIIHVAGAISFVLVVSYADSKGHRPRWIAYGYGIMGVGSIVFFFTAHPCKDVWLQGSRYGFTLIVSWSIINILETYDYLELRQTLCTDFSFALFGSRLFVKGGLSCCFMDFTSISACLIHAH